METEGVVTPFLRVFLECFVAFSQTESVGDSLLFPREITRFPIGFELFLSVSPVMSG